MPSRRGKNTEVRLAKLRKAGRGQGEGATWQPMIKVTDFASSGRVHRRLSSRHARVVHLLSDLEEDAFLSLEEMDNVLEVREQVPLPREATLVIAHELGIRHSYVDGVAVVMTTDLVAYFTGLRRKAISVKPSSELGNRRVLEKLEIERVYWEREGVPWSLTTEHELSKIIRINQQQVVPWRFLSGCEQDERHWDERGTVLRAALDRALSSNPDERVIDFVRRLEQICEWTAGEGLAVIRRLAATGLLLFPVNHRFDPFRSLSQLRLKAPPACS